MADVSGMRAGEGTEPARDRSTRPDARDAFDRLTETIWRLRQPDGCPWDRVQTHGSIAKNMLEEAYEAVECIEAGESAHLREELGDVLMQVMLHAQIAADAGEFTIADVVSDLDEKLIRRHPHVFGDVTGAKDAAQVLDIWDQVKRAEREGRASADGEGAAAAPERPAGLLDSVPHSLPALMQAEKVSKRAAKAGFEWETVDDIWRQVAEERAEFEAEAPGSPERELEFGDLLFALVNVARREGIDAESALRASTRKFRARWSAMEELAHRAGRAVEDLSTEELNRLWNEVKAGE
ncbi:nucleoside triphosphate pyrophosphohydrolase [Enorma burkinafasonensis]|uniref:nucleoside triphosphate pyrophosphohydrolase n=1 Tax=Enorma burkinafasonensis TaxID=2590867 RepID=UPI001FEA8465|nr:nucleoside triphosphate pyrophosphohydrolase [Enorma burkinafasonensis]